MQRTTMLVGGIAATVLVLVGVTVGVVGGGRNAAGPASAVGSEADDSASGAAVTSADAVTPDATVTSDATPSSGSPAMTSTSTWVSTSTSPPGPTTPQPPPQRCSGVDISGQYLALSPDADVMSLALCDWGQTYVAGSGLWSSWETRNVPADQLPGLVAELSVPSATPAPDRVCALAAYAVPVITVGLSDGRSLLVRIPDDGCQPMWAARELLASVAAGIAPTIEPVALQTPEKNIVTGCGGAKPLYPSTTDPATRVVLPKTALSACVFTTAADHDTTLQAAGPLEAGLARRLLDTLADTPPADCGPPVGDREIGSFVSVVSTPPTPAAGSAPTYPAGSWLFSVETDGCHVVVDGGWTTLGWADADLLTQVLAGTT